MTNQIINVLDYLHNEVGLIHLDLNPNNIMIDIRKNVKISDFGVSK